MAVAAANVILPESGIVNVAFVVSNNSASIDIAGAMQSREQVQSTCSRGFRILAVSETRDPIKAGALTIVPDYTFDNAPDVDIVVVSAQSRRSKKCISYLSRMAGQGKLICSIDSFKSTFPDAHCVKGPT